MRRGSFDDARKKDDIRQAALLTHSKAKDHLYLGNVWAKLPRA